MRLVVVRSVIGGRGRGVADLSHARQRRERWWRSAGLCARVAWL